MADKSSQNPFMDMFQNFGSSLNIPGPDMNDMMDYHRKNLQAIQAAVQVGSSSAQSLMNEQRAALEKTLADISESVQSVSKGTDPSAAMSSSVEIAKRTFDTTVQTTTDMAEIIRQGGTESYNILKDRVMESVEEMTSGKKT